MKKICLILSILCLVVVACSTTSLIPATPTLLVPASAPTETLSVPTSLPTETLSITSTPAPSLTSTQPTPTFTTTPTSTAVSTSTGTMLPLIIIPATSTSLIQPTPQGPVFESVTTSGTQINWGDTCDTNSITVTAQVASGFNVTSVELFTRLQSQNGNNTTAWNKDVSMHDDGFGTFTYELSTKLLTYYKDFNIAWVQYQLVAYNIQEQEAGRTQIYLNSLIISALLIHTNQLMPLPGKQYDIFNYWPLIR